MPGSIPGAAIGIQCRKIIRKNRLGDSMKLYTIIDWDEHFETHESRRYKSLTWVSVRTKLAGDGITELLDHEDGAAHYGAWMTVVIVASKCKPRGVLVRENGLPHDARSLSRITRVSSPLIQAMLDRVSDEAIKWVSVSDYVARDNDESPGTPGCQPGTPGCHTRHITLPDLTRPNGGGDASTSVSREESKPMIQAELDEWIAFHCALFETASKHCKILRRTTGAIEAWSAPLKNATLQEAKKASEEMASKIIKRPWDAGEQPAVLWERIQEGRKKDPLKQAPVVSCATCDGTRFVIGSAVKSGHRRPQATPCPDCTKAGKERAEREKVLNEPAKGKAWNANDRIESRGEDQ